MVGSGHFHDDFSGCNKQNTVVITSKFYQYNEKKHHKISATVFLIEKIFLKMYYH